MEMKAMTMKMNAGDSADLGGESSALLLSCVAGNVLLPLGASFPGLIAPELLESARTPSSLDLLEKWMELRSPPPPEKPIFKNIQFRSCVWSDHSF